LILKPDDENSFSLGEEIYGQLLKKGRKPLLDDRNIKIGQKFKENEILGFEETIVIGRKAKEGIVEYQNNKKSEKLEITIDYLDKL
jgi:prolyl-tRNA synthetase